MAHGCAAGVYTSPILLPLVADILESIGALDKLTGFVSTIGREFYKVTVPDEQQKHVILKRVGGEGSMVPVSWELGLSKVVAFRAGKTLGWEILSNSND